MKYTRRRFHVQESFGSLKGLVETHHVPVTGHFHCRGRERVREERERRGREGKGGEGEGGEGERVREERVRG